MAGKEQVHEARKRVRTLTLVRAQSREQRGLDFSPCFQDSFEFCPKIFKAEISGLQVLQACTTGSSQGPFCLWKAGH